MKLRSLLRAAARLYVLDPSAANFTDLRIVLWQYQQAYGSMRRAA